MNNKSAKLDLKKFTNVVASAVGTQPKPADAKIKLSVIDIEPQVRTTFGTDSLQELANSIQELGVIEPVILLGKGDGRYRLISGERRVRAALLINLVEIPALVRHGLSDVEIRQIQVAENNDREDLTPYDEANGVIADVEKFGFKEAQKIWNRSEGWISKRVAVMKYAKSVHDLLENNVCGDLEVLHSLNQLYSLSVEEFGHMVRRLQGGLPLSRDEARNKVSSVKAWQKEQAVFTKRRKEAEEIRLQSKNTTRAKVKNADDHNDSALVSVVIGKKEEKQLTALQRVQKAIFKSGEANLKQFSGIKSMLEELEHDMDEKEWVLWSSFLSVALPMLHALGNERALQYIKRLQIELKTKAPVSMWEAQHPIIDDADSAESVGTRAQITSMPADWRF